MPERLVDVLIIGAGPAGMLCACLLARAGLSVTVLERNEDFEREFRGEILQPRFHRVLQDVGLHGVLQAYPHEEIGEAHVYFEGQRAGGLRLDRLDARAGPAWWMTQPTLLRALHNHSRESKGFELWFGAAVKELGEGSATVTWKGEFHRLQARVIVGADGRFSSVRKLAGLDVAYDHHDLDVVWFNLPRPVGYEHVFSFFLTLRRAFLILPKYPNLLQCGMVLRPGEFNSVIRQRPLAEFQAQLAAAHPAIAEFALGLRDFSPFFPLKGNLSCAGNWAKDGLLLIGDAAHTCSPVGGIGVAIAMETAAVAADVILEAFESGDFSRRQLGKVQAARARDIARVHAFQRRVGRLVRMPPLLRRLIPLGFRLATGLGVAPLIARQLITRQGPLPIGRVSGSDGAAN